jgi:hypothetical protein
MLASRRAHACTPHIICILLQIYIKFSPSPHQDASTVPLKSEKHDNRRCRQLFCYMRIQQCDWCLIGSYGCVRQSQKASEFMGLWLEYLNRFEFHPGNCLTDSLGRGYWVSFWKASLVATRMLWISEYGVYGWWILRPCQCVVSSDPWDSPDRSTCRGCGRCTCDVGLVVKILASVSYTPHSGLLYIP